jgi:hypothetical protein
MVSLPMRRDRDYWARLRKDGRSNWSAGLATVAALMAVVTLVLTFLPGAPTHVRFNPLYWLALLPVAWWGGNLTAFKASAVRWMRPISIAAIPIGMVATALAFARGERWQVPLGLATVACVAAVASLILYRGSLLEREGPAR